MIGVLFLAKNVEKGYKDKQSILGAALAGGIYGIALVAGMNGPDRTVSGRGTGNNGYSQFASA